MSFNDDFFEFQSKLDEYASKDSMSEGAYLELSNGVKKLKEAMKRKKTDVRIDLFTDLLVKGHCINVALDMFRDISICRYNVRTVLFTKISDMGGKCHCWWAQFFRRVIDEVLVLPTASEDVMDRRRDMFRDIISTMPKDLHMQKLIVKILDENDIGVFEMLFLEEDLLETAKNALTNCLAEELLTECPIIITHFRHKKEPHYLKNATHLERFVQTKMECGGVSNAIKLHIHKDAREDGAMTRGLKRQLDQVYESD